MVAHNQTIVYAVHESIGHLGIFVSGAVARKEHQEFTANIDVIDVLPPGIYQAEIADKTPDTPNADLAYGDYVLSFERRRLDDVREIVERNGRTTSASRRWPAFPTSIWACTAASCNRGCGPPSRRNRPSGCSACTRCACPTS